MEKSRNSPKKSRRFEKFTFVPSQGADAAQKGGKKEDVPGSGKKKKSNENENTAKFTVRERVEVRECPPRLTCSLVQLSRFSAPRQRVA